MDLYLQFGWGMMKLCREFCQDWRYSTVILSPRDLKADQLERLSADITDSGGSVLLDPQFYLPRADHHRLTAHNYWPDNYETAGFVDNGMQVMVRELALLNMSLGTKHFIVPGIKAEAVDASWLDTQRALMGMARDATEQSLIATICLSGEAIRSMDQIARVIRLAENVRANGYYLVLERPGNSYLTDDPLWLANALDLAVGLRRLGSRVIVGYSNHQQLIMACAGVDAIASGTWLNVRSFSSGKFQSTNEDSIRRRAVWYYCPQALNEYRLEYLDLGVARLGLRAELYPDPSTSYAEPLFTVAQPSTSGWSEPDAFRHYLTALRAQAQYSTCESFDETVAVHDTMLGRSDVLLKMLSENGITGQSRDVFEALTANRAALKVFEKVSGPVLRRVWGDLV